jgi:hypothetical protein
MALDEFMPHMLRDHGSWLTNDGNYVMVSHLNEIISTAALVTKVNAWVLKPQGVDERFDAQCGMRLNIRCNLHNHLC